MLHLKDIGAAGQQGMSSIAQAILLDIADSKERLRLHMGPQYLSRLSVLPCIAGDGFNSCSEALIGFIIHKLRDQGPA